MFLHLRTLLAIHCLLVLFSVSAPGIVLCIYVQGDDRLAFVGTHLHYSTYIGQASNSEHIATKIERIWFVWFIIPTLPTRGHLYLVGRMQKWNCSYLYMAIVLEWYPPTTHGGWLWLAMWHGPLTRYVMLRVTHASGIPGKIFPPLT